jgi:hypothetical protein
MSLIGTLLTLAQTYFSVHYSHISFNAVYSEQQKVSYSAGQSSTIDFYLGGAWFKSQLHWLPWLRFLCGFPYSLQTNIRTVPQ